MIRRMMFLLLFVLSTANADDGQAYSDFVFSVKAGKYPVGLRIIQQYDYSRAYVGKIDPVTGLPSANERARPVQTLMWYPSKSDGKSSTYEDYVLSGFGHEKYGLTNAEIKRDYEEWKTNFLGMMSEATMKKIMSKPMWAKRDASPVDGKFPLVIYVPSFGASAIENADLCEYLASQGYVVLASSSMGQFKQGMTEDVEGIEAQMGDVEFLIGFGKSLKQVDFVNIGLIGYSWGGLSNVYTASKDNRVSAVVSIDGAERFSSNMLKEVKFVTPDRFQVPYLYVSGQPPTMEDLKRAKRDFSYSLIDEMTYSDVYKVTAVPSSHNYFSSNTIRMLPDDQFSDYSRQEVSVAYTWVARYVAEFLNAYLKHEATSLTFLKNTPDQNQIPKHIIKVEARLASGAPVNQETFAQALALRGFGNAEAIYEEMHKHNEKFKPDSHSLDDWAYKLLALNRTKDAISILKLETVIYPNDANAFASLGDVYQRDHQNELAIKSFKRSIEIFPKDNFFSEEHLKQLEAQAGR